MQCTLQSKAMLLGALTFSTRILTEEEFFKGITENQYVRIKWKWLCCLSCMSKMASTMSCSPSIVSMNVLRGNIWNRLQEWGKHLLFAVLDESRVEAEHTCKPLCQEGRVSKWCWFGTLEALIMDRRRKASAAVAGFAGRSGSADVALLLPRPGFKLPAGSCTSLLVASPACNLGS